MNRIGLIVGLALLALMAAASTLFIVDQRQVAVIVVDFAARTERKGLECHWAGISRLFMCGGRRQTRAARTLGTKTTNNDPAARPRAIRIAVFIPCARHGLRPSLGLLPNAFNSALGRTMMGHMVWVGARSDLGGHRGFR